MQAAWRATYRGTARWNKKRNPAIAVGLRATLYVSVSNLRCPFSTTVKSRAIAPIRAPGVAPVDSAAEAEAEEAAQQNVIAVVRSVILRVRAPRRRAVAAGVEEVAIAEVEEAEADIAVSAAVGVAKRPGATFTTREGCCLMTFLFSAATRAEG
jgi:hypothetical protein